MFARIAPGHEGGPGYRRNSRDSRLKPGIGSFLFEFGFVTNPEDAARLSSGEYQSKLSLGFVQAIRAFNKGGNK